MARALALLAAPVLGCGGSDPKPDTSEPASDTSTTPIPTDTVPITGEIEGSLSLHPEIATVVRVDWEQPVDTDASWLTWEVDGQTLSSPALARPAGPASEVLLGIPAQTDVVAVLHWRDGSEQAVALPTIRTGALPEDLIVPTLLTRDPARSRPEPWLLTSLNVGPYDFYGPFYTVILDAEGRIVWYRPTSESRMSWQVRPSRLGGAVTIDASTIYRGTVPTVTRTTLDLRQIEEIAVPGFAQAYDEMEDGSILFNEGSELDFWLTRQRPDGGQERLWACRPWMEPWSQDFWSCAANTVTWSPERGTALYSMFITDTVVELDLETGAILREFGAYPGGFVFEPETSTFQHQHLPNWTPSGTLMSQTDSPLLPGQWVREYEVDDETSTLREIFSLESAHFAEYAGQAQPLPSDNILWQHGTAGAVEELTRSGEVVWAVDWSGHLTGNVTPIPDLYALNAGW